MTSLLGIELAGRLVVVVGGGPVAERRARAALADGARVVVVAPDLCTGMEDLVERGSVRWLSRPVRSADLDGAWLVQAATDSSDVNDAVARWAEERQIWCVHASDAPGGTARTPAITHGDELLVGVVSTGSPDPRRIATVRDQLALLLRSGRIDQRRRRWLRRRVPARLAS